MPMYEYICDDCGERFELRRNISDADAEVRCSHCGSEKAKRAISAFACGTGSGDSGGDCGPSPSG